MASNKLTMAHTKKGRNKKKTRETTKEWREEKRKKFNDRKAELKKEKASLVYIKPSTIDWANKKKKEEEDYGYFLSRGEQQ